MSEAQVKELRSYLAWIDKQDLHQLTITELRDIQTNLQSMDAWLSEQKGLGTDTTNLGVRLLQVRSVLIKRSATRSDV